jgi:lysozyme family protein
MSLLTSLAAWLRRPQRESPADGGFPPLSGENPPGRKSLPPSRFAACVAEVLEHEGGYVDHAKDPGGATNLGITHITLASWRGAEVTPADVRALTRAEAEAIYAQRYWTPLRCADLPPGVDLMVFDFGVNAGPARSAKTLQRLLRVPVDGVVGPQTLLAARDVPRRVLICDLADARRDYYRGLEGWSTFGKGWMARVDAVTKAALAVS